jgi:hypothetical protein
MATKVYGASDDLIEFEGDFEGEVGCFGTDENERGVLVVMSDGTLLEVKFCGRIPGIWEVKLLKKGTHLTSIEQCADEDARPHSDVAHFDDGIKWAYAATEWEGVR